MAQLTDDCFAFSGPLLPLADMERLIAERVTPVAETERRDACAPRAAASPPPISRRRSICRRSTIRRSTATPCATPISRPRPNTALAIAGRLTAGRRPDVALKPGEAIRIFTGAAMPAGADTVFMQEDVRVDGDRVIVPSGLKLGANRRLAGEDVAKGAIVLPAGTVLEAQHVALAAALGLTEIEVRRRLKVAIFSTGDEVVEPGTPRGGAAIYDANRYLLAGLLERLGASVTDLGILADDAAELAQRAVRRGRRSRSGGDLRRCLHRRGRPRARGGRAHRQPRLLARRHQAGAAGRHGRDPRCDE